MSQTKPTNFRVLLFIPLLLALGCEVDTNDTVELGDKPFGAVNQDTPIMEIIAQTFVLQNVEAMLVATRVSGEMQSPPYTVFTPWDYAVEKLPYWEKITRNRAWYGHLRQLALGHIHEGNIPAKLVENDMTVTMVNGDIATITKDNSRVRVDGERVIGDTAASDGYIYMLDHVREPKWTKQTILDIIDSDERFSILAQILNHPNMNAIREELKSEDAELTFFAPTNEALSGFNIANCTDPECLATLDLLVGNHLVEALAPKMFTPTQTFATQSGSSLSWNYNTQSVTCTGADETQEELDLGGIDEEFALNGIVQPINTLLCTTIEQPDSDGDGTADSEDGCLDDPNKTEPGICGCGITDSDSDGDGTADCNDACPDDSGKIEPGVCGCGAAETDSDGDFTLDCEEQCPFDPDKVDPGACGCGTPDTDSNNDGVLDCNDGCPDDPGKTEPGICGCGTPDIDSDGDGALDCEETCPVDPNKTEPGACGCGTEDVDSNGNGTFDCNEECQETCAPNQQCGIIDDGCGGAIDCGTCGSGQVCENHTCIDNDPGYECDIVCTGGKILSDDCEPSVLVPGESLCEIKRDSCCVEDTSSCPTLCDDDEILDGDAYIYVEEMTCRDYLAGLAPSDFDCVDPFPHVPDTCCKSAFRSSPPADPDPCYDLCGDDLQMVGSRLIDDFSITCFDYASSLNADSAECTAPDPMIMDMCCDSPQPIPTGNTGNYCTLCGDFYGPPEERQYYSIGPNNLTCLRLDFDMSIDLKKSDAECTAKKEAFAATCCDLNYTPPEPVPQNNVDNMPQNPCTMADAPKDWCEGGDHPKCNLCKDGSYPKNPYTITTIAYIPGNPSCNDLYWMGLYNHLPAALCYPIQGFMEEPCGCN